MKKITLSKLLLFHLLLFVPICTFSQIGNVIWEDNFDTLNTDVWTPDVGDGCNIGLCGWGNQELQSYEENNVSIESIPGEAGNNALVFEARRENSGTRAYTSGKVVSEGKLSVQYGLIEIRMQVPDLNTGLWPAAWMLGTTNVTWPAKGEIDIMEMGHAAAERERQGHLGVNMNNYVGANAIFANEDGSVGSIAYDVGYNQPYTTDTSMANRFVTYRLYWEPTQMRYTILDNGVEYDLYTSPLPLNPDEVTGPFTKPFYFLMNLAVGGNFTDAAENNEVTAPLNAKVYIDYVRVSEWNGYGSVETDYAELAEENGTFGVFTENTPTQNELNFGLDGEIYIWGGTMVEGNEAAIEGDEVIAWETVAPNAWFGGGVASLFGKDMSNYVENGSLKFKIKIPADVPFRIGITDNFTNENWLTFNAGESKYGLVRDGEWGQVEIPLEDLAGIIAFQNINYMFAISSDPAAFPTSTFQLAIDDIVWEDGNASIPVTGISSSLTSSTLDIDDTLQLDATISPETASNQNVTWSSSDTTIATVNSSGLITAINSGNTTITVTTQDGSFTHTTTITVNEVVISSDNLALGKNVSQSTTRFGGVPERAVDGNTSGIWNQRSITHTAPGIGQSWEVDLGATYAIGDINIWNRTNCCSSRLDNITVTLQDNNENILWSETITSSSATTLSINAGGISGSIIKVTQNQNQALSLAEVQVYEYDGETPPDPTTDLFIEAEDYTAMNGVQLENTSDTNGGQNVGYIDPNDWLEYTVNIPSAGNYIMKFRVASAPGNGSVNITSNGASIGTFNVDATGGWQSWTDVTETVNLSAGNQNIRLTSIANGWNINWLEITPISTSLKASIADFQSVSESFSLYPVPTNEVLNISLEEYGNYGEIIITDMFGRTSTHQKVDGSVTTINVSQLKTGIYMLNILDKGNKIAISRKIIIE